MGIFRSVFGRIFTWGNKRPRRLIYAVGLYTIGYGIYDMSWASFAHNLREPYDPRKRYGKNTWVVISGTNDPISMEMAKRLSKYGFNLVFVDPSQKAMEKAE